MTLTKEVSGQDFKDLDLLAKLLAPRPPKDAQPQPVIEVLDSKDLVDENGPDELADRAQGLTLDEHELSSEQREILEGR